MVSLSSLNGLERRRKLPALQLELGHVSVIQLAICWVVTCFLQVEEVKPLVARIGASEGRDLDLKAVLLFSIEIAWDQLGSNYHIPGYANFAPPDQTEH